MSKGGWQNGGVKVEFRMKKTGVPGLGEHGNGLARQRVRLRLCRRMSGETPDITRETRVLQWVVAVALGCASLRLSILKNPWERRFGWPVKPR